MGDVRVLQMRNPEAVASSIVQELFSRAFKKDEHGDAIEAWEWCNQFLQHPGMAFLVALDEESSLVGMAVGLDERNVWNPDPFVLHIYSEGRDVFNALLSALREWAFSRGASKLGCINMTGHSDEAHMRSIREFAEGSIVGSLISYDLKDIE